MDLRETQGSNTSWRREPLPPEKKGPFLRQERTSDLYVFFLNKIDSTLLRFLKMLVLDSMAYGDDVLCITSS